MTEAYIKMPGIFPTMLSIAENDPWGLIIAAIGMGIVFLALLLMYLIFTNTPALFTPAFRQKVRMKLAALLRNPKQEQPVTEQQQQHAAELSGEVNAAIAAAIYLYWSELHDYEDTVLTIKKVSRVYSPWSSKIYSVRNPLRKN
jgi:glutaconyl-CoA/methylmalonyl-CoA decarboxylase subunit delta